jgi:uncharacterized membrane protein YqiK
MQWLVIIPIGAILVLILAYILFRVVIGLVIIGERQVGIVIKKIDLQGKSLPPGKLIALADEAGYQADTLAPGWHFGYRSWQYDVIHAPLTIIPQGQIGLVVAADGTSIPSERFLGKVVDCDDFQNARAFLTNGGEKGRQLGILTAGTYRINTQLFQIITAANAAQAGMQPQDLLVFSGIPDMVGIVTTLDGQPISEGEIAGALVEGHDNFQSAQSFIEKQGRRGLQEQVLLSGSWNLNPWFARVEEVPMTEIPIGYVGVVISFVGKPAEDVSGLEFKHGDLVNQGHKGVWVKPLYPGKHPLNTRVMKVELVPTTNIVLNWANRTEAHSYDATLSSITVRSEDGFAFNMDVSQIIHIGALDAPKVISRVGSVQNLVDHVLQPIIGNYFRNAAQTYTILDFLIARSERQKEAADHIRKALAEYDVQAIDTLIGDIHPPAELMATLTDRKLAQEQRKTFEVQMEAQTQRQQLVRETSLADIQANVVQAEQSVNIAEMAANAEIERAKGEAEAIRLRALSEAEAIRAKGDAQGEAYAAGAKAIGPDGYTAIQVVERIGDGQIRIVPDFLVTGAGNSGNGLVDALLAVVLQNQVRSNTTPNQVIAAPDEAAN